MNPTVIIAVNALWSLLAIVLVYVVARGYRSWRVDMFRDQLFALRDELFDLAESGQLGFDSAAYGLLRTTLNGFIRFGHRINVFSYLLATTYTSAEDMRSIAAEGPSARFPGTIQKLPTETQEALRMIQRRMHVAVLEQLLLGSPWLLLAVVCVLPMVALQTAGTKIIGHFVSNVYRRYEQRLDHEVFPVLDGQAYVEGEGAGAALGLAPLLA